ncbi:MAG: ABC transporter ATP-binding protein [Bacteroidaceae bacterium]|nr:ABC transporter ATP-binding protein [Bacteroidaceae bacterium]
MIQIRNLNFNYGKKEVLKDAGTQFEKGRIYGLLGPNGAGKTTLLKLICGILMSKNGYIAVEGENPFKRTPETLSGLFYLPEHPQATINKISTYAREYGQFYPTFNYEEFEQLMKEIHIDINAKFSNLSTGESKKAFIAFALALNTPYLLLDEPTNGLDVTSKGEFRQLISRYMSDERCIIIATHQIREISTLLDHIVILKDKNIVTDASIASLQNEYICGTARELPADALYSEESINGYNYIAPNNGGEESNIDIELLFNYINLKK